MSTGPKINIVSLVAKVEADVLRVSYEIVNQTSSMIALLDRVPFTADITQPPRFDQSSNAYLGVSGATLVVRKSFLPVPPGLMVSERVIPGITKLDAHGSRVEQITQALPVHAYDPHRAAQLRLSTPDAIDAVPSDVRIVTRVRIITGYFEVGDASLLPITPDLPDVFSVRPLSALSRYEEAESEVASSEPFEALEYEVVLGPSAP